MYVMKRLNRLTYFLVTFEIFLCRLEALHGSDFFRIRTCFLLRSEGFDWDDPFRNPKWGAETKDYASHIVKFAQILSLWPFKLK